MGLLVPMAATLKESVQQLLLWLNAGSRLRINKRTFIAIYVSEERRCAMIDAVRRKLQVSAHAVYLCSHSFGT